MTLLSLDNIKQMIYMRVAVETMVLRDFLEVQNPMVMEEIRHAIAMQKALIQTPGFEPEHFLPYGCTASFHLVWGCEKTDIVGNASGPAAALYQIQNVGFHNGNGL